MTKSDGGGQMKRRPSSASGSRISGYNLNPPYGRGGSKEPKAPKGKKE